MTEAEHPKQEWRIGFIALLICIIGPFASDCYVPSMPAIAKAFGSTANQIQLTMSMYYLERFLEIVIMAPGLHK